MLMFIWIDSSRQKFCEPFLVGCVLKLIRVPTSNTAWPWWGPTSSRARLFYVLRLK